VEYTNRQIKNDWNFSDRFIPAIRQIVGPLLLDVAPLEIDRNQATDFIVLRAKNLMIASRVRRPSYRSGYEDQFTLRSRRSSGTKTELEKIILGNGDWYFYGFSNPSSQDEISCWRLIDLHALRAHLIRNPEKIVRGEKTNQDGSSFSWFDLKSFPSEPPILIASSQNTNSSSAV
jgi:hypothetical protein